MKLSIKQLFERQAARLLGPVRLCHGCRSALGLVYDCSAIINYYLYIIKCIYPLSPLGYYYYQKKSRVGDGDTSRDEVATVCAASEQCGACGASERSQLTTRSLPAFRRRPSGLIILNLYLLKQIKLKNYVLS